MVSRTDDIAAEEIAEALLYRTGLALVHGQYDDVPDCFILPQTLETLEGARVVRSPDDVRSFFMGVRRYFQENGVTDVARAIVEAKFVADGIIESTHVSRLMKSGGEVFRAPYPVFSALNRCDDGRWRIATTCYGIVDSREHCEALLTWHSNSDQVNA